ncbi:MAG TPA: extracellular solute-binding protein [Chloroflexota bacterium]|nr:extracellular solute-binding protein [Chloroflexota bacterium]
MSTSSPSRRRFLSLSVALPAGAGALLAACGQAGGGATKQTVPLTQRPPMKLELAVEPTAGRKAQADIWNAKFPNIQVTPVTAPTGTGVVALEKFVASIAAGSAAPLVRFDRFQVATYAHRKAFLPLDDYVKRDKFDTKKFYAPALEEATGVADKKIYGIPMSMGLRLLFWNKDVFQQVGLDPEKPPKTWDEHRQMALRLTQRGGATGLERLGFHLDRGQAHYHLWAWQNGGGFQTPDGKKATLNTPQNIEALEYMQRFTRDLGGAQLISAFAKTFGSGAQAPEIVGQLATYMISYSGVGNYPRYRKELNFGLVIPPVKKEGDKPITWSGGFAYDITRDAKDPDVVWEIMKFFTSEEGYIAQFDGDKRDAQAGGGVYIAEFTTQPDLDRKMIERYKTGLPNIDKIPPYVLDQVKYTRFRELSIAADQLWDGIKASQTQAVSEDKNPKQALDENNVLVQQALDQAWASVPK